MKEKYTIGLGCFRIITCLLVIKNMCFYLPTSNELFGANGIFPYISYLELLKSYHLSFLAYPFNQPFAPQAFLLTVILFASSYLLGFGGRFSGMVLIILLSILKFRNGFILDGSDNVMQVTLPFLVLADSHYFFRYEERDTKESSDTSNIVEHIWSNIKKVALLGLMIQVCYVYFFTSLSKLQGDVWLNGTAIYYTMRVSDFMATSWNIPLTKNHYFVVLGTYFTIIFEIAFPFLIWFKKTKYWIIFLGIMLHIGIWIFMRIDNFSWIMIGTYFVFIDDQEYMNLKNWIINRQYKITKLFIN